MGFNATQAWTCWRDGGTCTGISYQVAGMQSLVNAVRATAQLQRLRQHGLISNYGGTPTAYGIGLRDHLVTLL